MSNLRLQANPGISSRRKMTSNWSYEKAFVRNRGLVSPEEQEILRSSCVAVAGLGGVGGVDLITLARLGIGKFVIADADKFDVSNSNRQYGAMSSTAGKPKAQIMKQMVLDMNPEADVRVINDYIDSANVDDFLQDADVFVDGIDAFNINVRRLVYRKAAEKGIFALGAGPVGFSTVWIVFDPQGMNFDRYFDLSDDLDSAEKTAAYILGMAPDTTYRSYIDPSFIDPVKRIGPSVGAACQLAGGVVTIEVLKILLRRGTLRSAPWIHQFDVYKHQFISRKLRNGNRGWWQKFKRNHFVKMLRAQLNHS